MWNRLVIAIVGASIITVGMFLGMSRIVAIFRQRDPTQYFQIRDFIPAPKGRRLPNLNLPESQPARAKTDSLKPGETAIEAEPSFSPEQSPRTGPRLRLDESLDPKSSGQSD